MPDLAQAEYSMELYNRLQKFWLQWYLDEKPVSVEEIVTARRLALCFGRRWIPVIMMWALACRARPQHDAFVQYEFRDTFNGEFTIPYLFANPRTGIASPLRELVEWEKLTRIAFTTQTRAAAETTTADLGHGADEEADDVASALQNLTL
ncbi:hypothetical protein G647_07144 [Cladophialophora carrionii CBS 160.54]|uniref:Uncharacterized protein n=1 Tax=Cladophialophora carrionii CBS 160.54 TaxID=1279043 RepID=V9D478_9EURO|nr:uncharacterized protein G647_07144 [Cladophialophora carrionii CBS 160.54]ETI20802.1 hypothetical protein G647_07144 [Cladophialophora carrionii CBS 160.54]